MDGVLNIYKPIGITSFDVVRQVRKICGTKKVGHTGTLDPEASGVLPVCIGRATKIVDYIMNEHKVYKAELKLGIKTDSYDREGRVLEVKDVNVNEDQVIQAIKSFVGEIYQVPPMYSALKVNGKKLYELARSGIEIEREPRKITIFSIEILNVSLPYVTFNVCCSKGTYIRSLCDDIGTTLKCGGTMWNLERQSTGTFKAEDSIELNKLDISNINNYLIPIDEALKTYEMINVPQQFEKFILNGLPLRNENICSKLEVDKFYRVYIGCDKFIGIGQKQDNNLRIIKLLV